MTFEEIAAAEKRDEYFDRALTEYKAAEHNFKLARNHIFRASVKNNVGVVLTKLGRFKEAHRNVAEARRLSVRFKDRMRTAQFDITRAEILIAEGKLKQAEEVAHKAALALEKSGQRVLEADALITQGTALARLGKSDRAHCVFQRAIKAAHEVGALNKAGLAALTLIEELDQLSADTLQAAYQQANDWLAGTQSQELLRRLNEAAGKLATSLRGEMTSDEAVAVLLSKPGDLQTKLLNYEHLLIKQALVQTNGAVTHAADPRHDLSRPGLHHRNPPPRSPESANPDPPPPAQASRYTITIESKLILSLRLRDRIDIVSPFTDLRCAVISYRGPIPKDIALSIFAFGEFVIHGDGLNA